MGESADLRLTQNAAKYFHENVNVVERYSETTPFAVVLWSTIPEVIL